MSSTRHAVPTTDLGTPLLRSRVACRAEEEYGAGDLRLLAKLEKGMTLPSHVVELQKEHREREHRRLARRLKDVEANGQILRPSKRLMPGGLFRLHQKRWGVGSSACSNINAGCPPTWGRCTEKSPVKWTASASRWLKRGKQMMGPGPG